MQNISLNVWDFGIRKYFILTTAIVHSHFHLRRSTTFLFLFYFILNVIWLISLDGTQLNSQAYLFYLLKVIYYTGY